jgi:hypothetical protein
MRFSSGVAAIVELFTFCGERSPFFFFVSLSDLAWGATFSASLVFYCYLTIKHAFGTCLVHKVVAFSLARHFLACLLFIVT